MTGVTLCTRGRGVAPLRYLLGVTQVCHAMAQLAPSAPLRYVKKERYYHCY